jgi:hypothetical protein
MSSLPSEFDSIEDYDSYASDSCAGLTGATYDACHNKKSTLVKPLTRIPSSNSPIYSPLAQDPALPRPPPDAIGPGGEIHDTRPNAPSQKEIPLYSPGITGEKQTDITKDCFKSFGNFQICLNRAFHDPKTYMGFLAITGIGGFIIYRLIKRR